MTSARNYGRKVFFNEAGNADMIEKMRCIKWLMIDSMIIES